MKGFKWRKLGRIFNPQEIKNISWMKEFAQAPSVLLFDEFVRVYFSCRPLPDKNGHYVSYSAYVDFNRFNLFEIINIAVEPILKLGGLGTFDEFGTYPVSVIRDGNATIAYYAGWTRCESVPFNTAIGYAISHDNGNTFVKIGDGPILSYSPEEPFIISGPKIRKFNEQYYLWYIAGKTWVMVNDKPEMCTKIRMAISNDGRNWSKVNRNIIGNTLGDYESQASPDVFYCNGKYHMFFCFWDPTNFRETKWRRIGYAVSKDMLNWERDDTKACIDVSTEGWDSEMIAYPHLFKLDDAIYMLYLGNQIGRYGFGLAQLEGELI
jgi:predicted GH43/DUF377 family glycosyl hydrolase